MISAFSFSRRCFVATILSVLSMLGLASNAAAEAPMQRTQAPATTE